MSIFFQFTRAHGRQSPPVQDRLRLRASSCGLPHRVHALSWALGLSLLTGVLDAATPPPSAPVSAAPPTAEPLTPSATLDPAASTSTPASTSADGAAFTFATLEAKARALAAQPYQPRVSQVTPALKKLTYDQYRDIRFNPEAAWWRAQQKPFQLQFFHPGFIYDKTVQLNEIVGGAARPIPFRQELFNYGANRELGTIPESMGFTGFRIHYPLNSSKYYDELAVFQGASYFRMLGQIMRYGLSARGLALNTAEPVPEEFPIFEEFWIEQPGRARQLTVYALLDSPSVAGAYRFVITPGAATVAQIKVALYRRKDVAVFGIAPLTSMFWFGENNSDKQGDLRPEVHDSDGLLMERGNGEWLFRPLVNPTGIRVSAFSDENPRGFGLVQRDRAFASYQDLEAHYHDRPSAWVQPLDGWGKGQVRLVELPTPDETNDNIVAFWVPAQLPPLDQPLRLEYRLHWFMETQGGGRRPPAAYATATRIGRSKTHEPELTRFWVDFDGDYIKRQADLGTPQAAITVGEGAELVHQGVEKNPYDGSWRVAFSIRPKGPARPVELRCFLKSPVNVLSETWTYLWTP